LLIGSICTFESESGPGLFISYGASKGIAAYNAANRKFKIMPPLNGRAGCVSLQAIDLAGEVYLVMAEVCARPYITSFHYNVSDKPATDDPTFNANASFEVRKGNSNQQNEGLVSLRVNNGTHFVKREQGVVMAQPGAAVAPRYQNHFTFKIPVAPKNTLSAGGILKAGEMIMSANAKFGLVMQTDGHLVIYHFDGGVQGAPVWGTHVYGFPNQERAYMEMQTDGNLVEFTTDAGGTRSATIWTTNTAGQGAVKAVLDDDGILRLYDAAGNKIWSSQ
ncbi:MAG: hypothetical protein ACKVTZ_11125, partial [Bacteroidia bacterium]